MTVGYLVLTAVVGNLTSESSLIMKKLESNKRKSSMFVFAHHVLFINLSV